MQDKRKSIRKTHVFELISGILIILMMNIAGSYIFFRLDLTSEKRYSLSTATKELLRELDDIVYFQVYLEGDFPAGFKRLRNSTKEMLDEFRAYSDFIEYDFINPSASDDPSERNSTYNLLVERGLNPTDLQVSTGDGMSKQIIFPGAIVSYRGDEMPVELLRSQLGIPPVEVLNNSIQELEFNLANAVKNITATMKPKVAFITGHGELGELETADITRALSDQYQVERVEIDGKISALTERNYSDTAATGFYNKFKAIIIAQPDSAFSEKDKFIIDQYIMRGGKVLWLIDPMLGSMDSLQKSGATVSISKDLNLEDMLFNYGVRLNYDLVMDLNALPIPLTVGSVAGQPQIDFFDWYYLPVITPMSEHPVVKNLNAIKTEFVSSMDTIAIPGIRKTVLLTTSPYSRIVNAPVYINLNILQQEPDPAIYSHPPVPLAILLEGSFSSVYENRMPPTILNSKEIGFREKSQPTGMIVISDGDVIRNQFHFSQGYPLPLGYDQYTRQTFGNKELILNALNYLTDGPGLISIRSRELKLRLLDITRANQNKLFWQLFNVLTPVVVIVLAGIVFYVVRRRRYAG
ncbi:MAG: gliding motility-associated ABC transporter substrate-binding protein GldG [Bacteroidetes bacterium]|nr:gliding motility-associated ABC transporter substrate-binding protein GldG [Bacteroidota bacterium]